MSCSPLNKDAKLSEKRVIIERDCTLEGKEGRYSQRESPNGWCENGGGGRRDKDREKMTVGEAEEKQTWVRGGEGRPRRDVWEQNRSLYSGSLLICK